MNKPKILIYNSLMEHSELFSLEISVDEFEEIEEAFDDFLNDNFDDEDGFYEYDGCIDENVYQVQIDDECDGWEGRFQLSVSKIKNYFEKEKILSK